MLQRVIPVILSGGAGTRLWPESRNERPKQFLPLLGGETMFQTTLKRVSDKSVFLPPIIVTGQDFRFLVEQELRRQEFSGHVLLEPLRRDSAAAIAVAAALAMEKDPNALLFVMAVDHLIRDVDKFIETVKVGIPAAQDGWIVTFGIEPDGPSSAFGYIEPTTEIGTSIRKVGKFIEKPTLERATTLIAKGCLWNSGNFLLRTDVLMAELHEYAPAIAAAALTSVKERMKLQEGPLAVDLLEPESFAASPSKSIDYAIMEHSQKAAVISANYDWSDLGSWDALWAVMPRDSEGNALSGAVTVLDTHDSLVSSTGPHVAVLNLTNVAVLVTPDAVLVAPRQVANELKPLVAQLLGSPATAMLTVRHQTATYIWGQEEILVSCKTHSLRRVHVTCGFKYKTKAPEGVLCHMLVVSGEADLADAKGRTTLLAGQHVTWAGSFQAHLGNSGPQTLVLIETFLNLQSEKNLLQGGIEILS